MGITIKKPAGEKALSLENSDNLFDILEEAMQFFNKAYGPFQPVSPPAITPPQQWKPLVPIQVEPDPGPKWVTRTWTSNKVELTPGTGTYDLDDGED